jgi:sec-independent protein translocase protein TatB
MLDIGSSELLLIIVVAVVVIGPKDLPRVLYKLGQIIGKGRAMTRHFRAGIDEMVRHAELEEMEKKWAADNARIMAQSNVATPAQPTDAAPAPQIEPLVPMDSYDPPEASPAFQVDPGQLAHEPAALSAPAVAAPDDTGSTTEPHSAEPHRPDAAA